MNESLLCISPYAKGWGFRYEWGVVLDLKDLRMHRFVVNKFYCYLCNVYSPFHSQQCPGFALGATFPFQMLSQWDGQPMYPTFWEPAEGSNDNGKQIRRSELEGEADFSIFLKSGRKFQEWSNP